MYYSYVEIEYRATNFSPARTDLALKLLISLLSDPSVMNKKNFAEGHNVLTGEVENHPSNNNYGEVVLGRQANLKESSKSKELAKLRLQVLVVV
jgi:hypothetical protein